jgi:hypothetical protein
MQQTGGAGGSDAEGVVELLNSDYTTNRFAFSYSWWSAYGFKRRCKSDMNYAEGMTLIDQGTVYDQVGTRIKSDLLSGSAVVIFAYGLSGSGKTYSVFGMDDPKGDNSWFFQKDDTTDDAKTFWGVFPRLGFEVFRDRGDGWKIKMKYFQNVVDIVRDLMSPTGEEQQYKAGMRKDEDGFMDIDWCGQKVLSDWDDLRATFQTANARKAISPTQFNHQSTRGHCIMMLEVEKPQEDDPSTKDRGRLYVCDLAGTEPAGDIFYAEYKTVKHDDGTVDHDLIGPHKDQRKTKELQDQGKKINLSLSEMAQFFMKMAQAVKAKKLKPGKTIPGCNSYFLCKYLKDTMVQAKTYLFCAIRPEVKYHKYTYATLGFAKNASVIKLAPKKAMSAASPQERKLMAELEQMKQLVAELRASGGGEDSGAETQALAQALAAKQAEMAAMMSGDSGSAAEEAKMKQQQEEYLNRGISLSYFDKDTEIPHFINLDDDPFRSERFMYIFDGDEFTFGPGGNMRPPGLTVVRDHCKIKQADGACTIIGGQGTTFVNGTKLEGGQEQALSQYDRIVMGSEIFLYKVPPYPEEDHMSMDDIVDEYQKGLMASGGGGGSEAHAALAEQMAAFEEEKKKWAEQNGGVAASGGADAAKEAQTMLAMEKEIAELMPKTKQLKQICDIFNRDMLTFDVSFQRGSIAGSGMGTPTVKVKVSNHASNEHVFIDPFEFTKGFSVLRDEMQKMRNAIENDREYMIPEPHDPVTLLFDNTFFLGASVVFPEFLIYNLETDPEDTQQDITSVGQGARQAGKLEICWTPLAGPEPEDWDKEVEDVLEPDELIGKSWTAKCEIKGAVDLPLMVDVAYCQYDFWDFGAGCPQVSCLRCVSQPIERLGTRCTKSTPSHEMSMSFTCGRRPSPRARSSARGPPSPCWTTSSCTPSTK